MNPSPPFVYNHQTSATVDPTSHFHSYLQTVIGSLPDDVNAGDGLRALEKQIMKSQGKPREEESQSESSEEPDYDDNSTIATTFTLFQQQFRQHKHVKLEGLSNLHPDDEEDEDDDATQAWEKMDKEDLIAILKSMRVTRQTRKILPSVKKEPPKKDSSKVKKDERSIRLGGEAQEDYSVKLPPWAKQHKKQHQKQQKDSSPTKKEVAKDPNEFDVKLPPWFHQDKGQGQKAATKEESTKKKTASSHKRTKETSSLPPPEKSPRLKKSDTSNHTHPVFEPRTHHCPGPVEVSRSPPRKELKTSNPVSPSLLESQASKPHKARKGVSFPSLPKQLSRRSLFRRRTSSTKLLQCSDQPEPCQNQPPTPKSAPIRAAASVASVPHPAGPEPLPTIRAVPQNIQSLLHSAPAHKEGVFLANAASASSRLASINRSWKQYYTGNDSSHRSSMRGGRSRASRNSTPGLVRSDHTRDSSTSSSTMAAF